MADNDKIFRKQILDIFIANIPLDWKELEKKGIIDKILGDENPVYFDILVEILSKSQGIKTIVLIDEITKRFNGLKKGRIKRTVLLGQL